MIKQLLICTVLVVAAIGFYSCSCCKSDCKNDEKKSTVSVAQYSDSGKMISATVGEEFEIAIINAPAAGFVWTLQEPLSENLELMKTDFITEPGGPSEKPKTGNIVWRFKALKPGKLEIQFNMVSGWREIDRRVFGTWYD